MNILTISSTYYRALKYLAVIFFTILITSYVQGLYFFLGLADATASSLLMRSVLIAITPVLLLPVIYWVSVKKPIFRNWQNVLLHIFLSALFSVVFLMLFQLMIWYFFRGEYFFALNYNRITEILFLQFLTIGSILFFTYWGLVVLLGLDQYYRELEDIQRKSNELQAQLELATLSSLRAQLKPHFLFNTLSMVDQMIRKNPEGAVATVDKLEKLLRNTFDRTTSETCTIEEEIDFIRKYLAIEERRFHDRLEVKYQISPETKDIKIPRYLLQPLVENALVHGVAKTMEPSKIIIKSEFCDNQLLLAVENSGPGLKRSWKRNKGFNFGLQNVSERLALYFGEKTHLNLTDAKSEGAVAEIRIDKEYLQREPASTLIT